MKEKLAVIKNWLGTGSINIFGLPMSGKDTVGLRLAEDLGAKFLSSGIIIRAMENAENRDLTASGKLIPTDTFYDIILPYFERKDLQPFGLVLSSVGRWAGEEDAVMEAAANGGHPIKVVVSLNISETDVTDRRETALTLNDRGGRTDDLSEDVFKTRILEFKQKTLPVIRHYQELGLLISVQADMTREEVYAAVVDAVYDFALKR